MKLLMILGFPIWFTLYISLVAVLFSLCISFWSVVIALFASFFACAAVGGMYISYGYLAFGVAMIGAALVCAGLSMLFFIFSKAITKGSVFVFKKLTVGIFNSFKC